MSAIVHHASPGAIGQPSPAVSGNTYASRPTKQDPLACDCCDASTDCFSSLRSEVVRPYGSLPYVLCHECLKLAVNVWPDDQRKHRFVVRRAARFGIQWEDAVRAQLGWPA